MESETNTRGGVKMEIKTFDDLFNAVWDYEEAQPKFSCSIWTPTYDRSGKKARPMLLNRDEKISIVGDTYQEVWDLFQEHIKAKGAEK